MDPRFWVRLGPTLIGSRFSRASRCAAGLWMRKSLHVPAEHAANACAARKGGEGACFLQLPEDETKKRGCLPPGRQDLADFCFLCPWPFADFFYLNSAGFAAVCRLLLGACTRCFSGDTLWVWELGSSPCSVSWGGGKHFCQAEEHCTPPENRGGHSSAWARSLLCYPGCYTPGSHSTRHAHFCFNFVLDWVPRSHTQDRLTYLRAESGLVYPIIDWLTFSCSN